MVGCASIRTGMHVGCALIIVTAGSKLSGCALFQTACDGFMCMLGYACDCIVSAYGGKDFVVQSLVVCL